MACPWFSLPARARWNARRSHLFRDCAVGWSGNEFLVVYVAEAQLFAQRIRSLTLP